jgi:phosphate transport system protein
MHRHFEDELRALKERLVHMGGRAERMITDAIAALVERSAAPIEGVMKAEQEVNDLHIEIDERVVELLALQHPVATDLRLLVMASKIAGELERIGDQAVNVCENTKFLLESPPIKPLVEFPVMAQTVQTMVRESLDAFVRGDVGLAQTVLNTDDTVDAFKNQIFRELLTYMMSDPRTIQRSLALILVARNLERVGDHATNVAEEVIYLVQGRDVRHHHEKKKRASPEADDYGR